MINDKLRTIKYGDPENSRLKAEIFGERKNQLIKRKFYENKIEVQKLSFDASDCKPAVWQLMIKLWKF